MQLLLQQLQAFRAIQFNQIQDNNCSSSLVKKGMVIFTTERNNTSRLTKMMSLPNRYIQNVSLFKSFSELSSTMSSSNI